MDWIEDVLIPILIILGAMLIWDGWAKDVVLSFFSRS